MISRPLVCYVLKASVRDRLFIALLLAVAVCASLAIFMGSAAIVEAKQFVVVFAAAGLRLAAVATLTLFIVFYIRRAFETRDIDFLLSRPLSRPQFILSHAVAFIALAVFVGLIAAMPLVLLAAPYVGVNALLWAATLLIELVIVAMASLFFAMVVPSAAGGVLSVFGLYTLSRLMGEILGILKNGLELPGYEVMGFIMHMISLAVPRLDLMAQSSWVVHGADPGLMLFLIAQGIVYSALLAAAATIDLIRRQF